MDDCETVNLPVIVQDIDTTPVRQGWDNQVGELLELVSRVERRRQECAGLGEEMPNRLSLLACRNVTGNLRGPDDQASTIPDGRDSEGDIESGAILVQPLGLVMVDALPTLQAFEQMGKIIGQVGRHQEGEWLPNGFFRAVPVKPFRAPVPASDDSLQGMANDRVIRGVDNGRQALPGFFTP